MASGVALPRIGTGFLEEEGNDTNATALSIVPEQLFNNENKEETKTTESSAVDPTTDKQVGSQDVPNSTEEPVASPVTEKENPVESKEVKNVIETSVTEKENPVESTEVHNPIETPAAAETIENKEENGNPDLPVNQGENKPNVDETQDPAAIDATKEKQDGDTVDSPSEIDDEKSNIDSIAERDKEGEILVTAIRLSAKHYMERTLDFMNKTYCFFQNLTRNLQGTLKRNASRAAEL